MAFDSEIAFFAKVFGPAHATTQVAQALVDKGLKFEVGLYILKALSHGAVYQVTLTKGSTSLMKGVLPPELVSQNKTLITEWLDTLALIFLKTPATEAQKESHSHFDPPGWTSEPPPTLKWTFTGFSGNKLLAIKAIQTLMGWSLTTAKTFVESVQSGKDGGPLVVGPNHAAAVLSALLDAKVGAMGLSQLGNETVNLSQAGARVAQIVTGQTSAVSESVKGLSKATVKATASVQGLAEGLEHGPAIYQSKPKQSPQPQPKKTSQVISLRDAEAIGQPVHGTSSGSVYYTVATGPRVRLAARVHKGGSVSIRAEWKPEPTADEKKKLQDIGLQMKSNYASMHLNAAEVPVGRVIGAFVVGVGLEWDAIVKSSAELVVEG